MTVEEIRPEDRSQVDREQMAARMALSVLDPVDVADILEHLDVLVAEGNEPAIMIAERIRQEKESAWRECWRAAVGLDEASNIPNPYKADQ